MKAHDYLAYGSGAAFGLALFWLFMWLMSAYFQDKVISIPWGVTDPERVRERERKAPQTNRCVTQFFRRTQWVSIMFAVVGLGLVIGSAVSQ